jgi:hypothetical protein
VAQGTRAPEWRTDDVGGDALLSDRPPVTERLIRRYSRQPIAQQAEERVRTRLASHVEHKQGKVEGRYAQRKPRASGRASQQTPPTVFPAHSRVRPVMQATLSGTFMLRPFWQQQRRRATAALV